MGKIRTVIRIAAMIGPCLCAGLAFAQKADVHSPWADDADVLGAVSPAPAAPIAPVPPVSPDGHEQAAPPSPEEELRMADEAFSPGMPGSVQSGQSGPSVSEPTPAGGGQPVAAGSGRLRQYDLGPTPATGRPAASPDARRAAPPSPSYSPASRAGSGGTGAPLPVYIGIRAR